MAVFANAEKMYEVLGTLFNNLMNDMAIGPKFKAADIILKFNIDSPSGFIWLTPGGVICGDAQLKPSIEMSLSGDTCHKFWLKEISMTAALAKGQIKTRGSLPKVMKLLPLLKPAYAMYPEISKRHGL